MTKNLIVKISNGFGNQMFLYAAAYAFSRKMGYNLLIDNESGIKSDLKKWNKKKRINWKPNYELDIFNLNSEIADKKYKFLNTQQHLKRKYLIFKDRFFSKKGFIIEKMNEEKKTFYSEQYLLKKYYDTIYMQGYFESEKYFSDYKKELLKEFSFKFLPNLKNNLFMKMIEDSEVVSIAFRAGRFSEFVNNNTTELKKTENFEKQTVKYIYRGVEFFKTKLKDPKFLIWSDNFYNLNKHFDPNLFTFVKNETKNKILLDFFLMCKCKYFIVGPTSFHWWPAWLCNYNNKIIVCPKNVELNISSNLNFWPDSWIKI
mgnify:CR=1 FL=1|jgi:hypothetical protein|tara:strand:+ start:5097 stop:6041 length:945 start_codon:yes stop_codon:yes gene_type:complete